MSLIAKRNSKLVRQPYDITFSRHNFNTPEQRILFRIIEALQPDVNSILKDKRLKVVDNLLGDKILSIPTKFLLPHGSKNYTSVKEALKALKAKEITLRGCGKYGSYETYTGVILKSRYYHNNEMVEIQICKDILPHYLNLSRGFTKYVLSIAFNLSSPHSMRIYQQLCHWVTTVTQLNLYVDECKKTLGLEDKYPDSSQFRQSILLPAQKELKEKADVYFDIKEPIKEGRKVVGWKIAIHKKEGTERQIEGKSQPLHSSKPLQVAQKREESSLPKKEAHERIIAFSKKIGGSKKPPKQDLIINDDEDNDLNQIKAKKHVSASKKP